MVIVFSDKSAIVNRSFQKIVWKKQLKEHDMKLYEITHIKEFTAKLFAETAFDEYLLSEAQFSTAVTYSIDGHINEAFVGEEDMQLPEYQEGYLPWKRIRPICYQMIKGRKVPQFFKIVLKLPKQMVDAFVADNEAESAKENISGLFLNMIFRNNLLNCTSGIAMNEFSMDKALENLWDEHVGTLLKEFL